MMIDATLFLFILLVATGLLTGALSALFGLGGGIIMVPILYHYLDYLNLSKDMEMHVAIATALITMLVITSNSIYAHYKRGNILLPVVKQMFPWMGLGAFLGSIVGSMLQSSLLHNLFVGFLLLAIIAQVCKKDFIELRNVNDFIKPSPFHTGFTASLIGFISVLIGIGGSIMTVPFLRKAKMPIKNAASIAVALVPAVSIFGTLGYLLASVKETGLPSYNIGYIYLPAFFSLSLGSLIGVPIGIRVSQALSDAILAKAYLLLLICLVISMLI